MAINDILIEIYKTSIFAGNTLIQWLGIGCLLFLFWKYFAREFIEDVLVLKENFENRKLRK